jgi:hypothetical protein
MPGKSRLGGNPRTITAELVKEYVIIFGHQKPGTEFEFTGKNQIKNLK